MLQELLVSGDLVCRPAESRSELEAAFRLVYANYVRMGYIEENPSKMRMTVFNALPTSTTFVSVLRGTVIATLTILADTPAGLPMDEIYSEELDRLRGQGRKLAELTMLADRRKGIERPLEMVVLLMKRAFDLAMLVLEADDLVITINPRHHVYYERRLLFNPLGEAKAYPSVRNNPALGKRLDLREVEAQCADNPLLQRQFFQERTPRENLLAGYVMTPEDLRYFFIEKTDIFRSAPPDVMAYLQQVRPDCPWRQWGFEPPTN